MQIRSRFLCSFAILALSSAPLVGQSSLSGKVEPQKALPPVARVVQEVRGYRQANEDRIVRELREFLSIPNVASDTLNIQRNADHLKVMLEARGVETHLLSIEGRGPVV